MIGHLLIWTILVSGVIAALAAMAARALATLSRHEIEQSGERWGQATRATDIVQLQSRVMVVAECIQWLASATGVIAATLLIAHAAKERSTAGWSLIVVLGVLLLLAPNVWIPAAMAHYWAAPFLFRTWPIWRFLYRLGAVLALGGQWTDRGLGRLSGRAPQAPSEESLEDEIRTIVSEGQREGLIEEDAREMIEGVIDLADADVSSIMTPRTSMFSMHVGLSIQDTTEFVVESGHSRIPVYDKSRDDIVGILYSKDLLAELAKPPAARQPTVGALVRPASFVPESKPVDELLQEFQRTRNHMAVVLDEYGGVAGLVTIEDVLEEIVGEITDEHDAVAAEGIRRLDERTSEVLASVHLDEINEQLALGLESSGDFDTIGGFVFSQLGHVPTVGEQLTWKNYRITVLAVAHRRIERIRIEALDEAHSEQGEHV